MPLKNATASLERLQQQAGRVHEIVQVLAKYRLTRWLLDFPVPHIQNSLRGTGASCPDNLSREARVRLALTELGTTFIKVGQFLSTRPDLIGDELAGELSKLQSETPADPPDVVRATIKAELGAYPEQIFAKFEVQAFASASVAQVHRADLQTGESVAVKIQKAGIRPKIDADLSILASLAELAEKHAPDLKSYEPVQLVAEFKRSLLGELDFTRERRNLDSFNRNFAEDEFAQFPRAWPAFSTKRVLTMDFMEGILSSDSLRLQESGEDLVEFARRGATTFLNMIFRDSFYHADPHPGNLMMLPGNIVGVLDCGMVGRLDEGLHDDFGTLMLAISQNDAEILTDTLLKLSSSPHAVVRERLQADLSVFLADTTQQSISEIDLAASMNHLTLIIRRYKISLQPGLSQLLRTLVLLEGTGVLLNPKFSLLDVIKPFYEKILLDRFSPKRLARRFERGYREWDLFFETLPRELNEALQKVQLGEFVIHLEHRHLDAIINRLVLGIIVGSLVLGSSLLWSMKAPPLANGISIVGAAGYLIAIALGWVLFRSVERSGKTRSSD